MEATVPVLRRKIAFAGSRSLQKLAALALNRRNTCSGNVHSSVVRQYLAER